MKQKIKYIVQDILDVIKVIVIAIVIITSVMFIFMVPLYFIGDYECKAVQEKSGYKTEFDLWAGCFVNVDGKMIPKTNWNVVTKPEESKDK